GHGERPEGEHHQQTSRADHCRLLSEGLRPTTVTGRAGPREGPGSRLVLLGPAPGGAGLPSPPSAAGRATPARPPARQGPAHRSRAAARAPATRRSDNRATAGAKPGRAVPAAPPACRVETGRPSGAGRRRSLPTSRTGPAPSSNSSRSTTAFAVPSPPRL